MTEPSFQSSRRKLLACRALMASNVYAPFFIIYLTKNLHLSIAEALDVIPASKLFGGLLEAPTGYLADHYGRRRCLIWGSGLCVGGLVMYATAGHFNAWFITGMVVAYLGWSLSSGADSTLAIDVHVAFYGPDYRPAYRDFEAQATSYSGLTEAAGGLAGAGIVLLGGLSLTFTLWAQALVYVPMVILAWQVTEPGAQQRPQQSLHSIIGELKRQPHLLAVMACAAVMASITAIVYQLAPLYYGSIRYHNAPLPTGWYGIVWATYVASTWLFRRLCVGPLTRRRFSLGHTLVLLLVIGSTCYLILGLTVSVPGLLVIFGLFLVRPLQGPLLTDYIGHLADPAKRTTITSISRIGLLALPSGICWIVGLAIESRGLAAGLLLASLTCAFLGAGSIWAMRVTKPA